MQEVTTIRGVREVQVFWLTISRPDGRMAVNIPLQSLAEAQREIEKWKRWAERVSDADVRFRIEVTRRAA